MSRLAGIGCFNWSSINENVNGSWFCYLKVITSVMVVVVIVVLGKTVVELVIVTIVVIVAATILFLVVALD